MKCTPNPPIESDSNKMKLFDIDASVRQREKALAILNSKLRQLSKLYKECFLSMGRGALLIYASNIIEKKFPNQYDYRTKKEMLEIFDAPKSAMELGDLIDNYHQNTEGILTLITSYSNATYFVIVKLR